MRQLNNGQSALIHMMEERPAPARTWTIHCPPGMLAGGLTSKSFTSLHAFEGYIAALRDLGCVVAWPVPHTATVEARA